MTIDFTRPHVLLCMSLFFFLEAPSTCARDMGSPPLFAHSSPETALDSRAPEFSQSPQHVPVIPDRDAGTHVVPNAYISSGLAAFFLSEVYESGPTDESLRDPPPPTPRLLDLRIFPPSRFSSFVNHVFSDV